MIRYDTSTDSAARRTLSGAARVLLALPPPFVFITLGWFRAAWVLALWFAIQLFMSLGASGQGGVAFGAHIGGFVAGALLIPFFKYAHVPLWRRQ